MSFIIYNEEGNNMEQITTTITEAPATIDIPVALTDEELAALLAKGTYVSTDGEDETDEQKVILN